MAKRAGLSCLHARLHSFAEEINGKENYGAENEPGHQATGKTMSHE
ncbi:hypothetical protein LDG_8114 [Legionella drancourtii LLAP12]|uniref:Uncharacterized protein n=1 Tax=Legionella drancourtii LLAP12 TaxID=658187 RepID=G9ES41_9GAMM|nr:hypothetical protein LDG_8114 [Legionella drancourtii LLAP12]